MAPAKQKNSPAWCDLVTLERYPLRRGLRTRFLRAHHHLQYRDVKIIPLSDKEGYFNLYACIICACIQDVWVTRSIFFWAQRKPSHVHSCSCSYCVYSTNGLLSPCLPSFSLFLPLLFLPYHIYVFPRGLIKRLSSRGEGRGEERGEERRLGGGGSSEEWSLLPHMSGQERVEWRSSPS